MSNCPFYGYLWPERSPTLRWVGTNQCGLDVDRNEPCKMERDGKEPNYHTCSIVNANHNLINAAKRPILHEIGQSKKSKGTLVSCPG